MPPDLRHIQSTLPFGKKAVLYDWHWVDFLFKKINTVQAEKTQTMTVQRSIPLLTVYCRGCKTHRAFSSSRIWLGYSRRPWVWTWFPLQPLGIPLLLHTVFVPWGNEAKTIRAEQKRIWGRSLNPAGGLGDGILTYHHSQSAKSEQGHEVGSDAWEKVTWRSQTTENDSDVHGIYIQCCGKAFGKLPANPDVLKDVYGGTGHA